MTTHLTGIIKFKCGAVITMISSFDCYKHGHCPIEIYGTEGSLQVPDPNTFDGPVRVFKPGYEDWKEVPLTHGYTENSRSIGAADMAYALRSGRPHRANGQLANHVLEIMLAFDKSSEAKKEIVLETTCDRPEALPLGLEPGMLPE